MMGHVENGFSFFAAVTLALHLVTATTLYPPHSSLNGAVRIVRVRRDGAGDFRTVTEAVNSIPSGNKRRVVVWIGIGEYREKVTVDRTKPFVTFYGERNESDSHTMPIITYHATALRYGTVDSATVAVESDYFVAVNVAFVNSSPRPDEKSVGAQAVAMRISGDKAAFYNCKFVSFQDTLCDDKGRHFFKDCYIKGSYDFIFGNGKSIYLRSTIESVAKGLSVITAQARESIAEDTGFSFLHCNITGSGNRNTYLGRAWKKSPRVVFAHTYMGSLISARGWFTDQLPQRNSNQTIYYGEYRCMGTGAVSSGRVKFRKTLSYEEAKPFMSMAYIHGGKWVVPPPKL
ncbi:putative pectinesterase 63 [Vigna unguiculata]|uniref:pectinesterase n=1 Tax=Vigna unguiculata TaxID=3917 RepID=A0A4D6KUC3_VIGUN|nr:putative pectinesterase 63 [Vigna unguiculata]QCD80193.1 pectinesterase [Vigna unguiculata]